MRFEERALCSEQHLGAFPSVTKGNALEEQNRGESNINPAAERTCPYAWLLCIKNKNPQLQLSWRNKERYNHMPLQWLADESYSIKSLNKEGVCWECKHQWHLCRKNLSSCFLKIGLMLKREMLSWFIIYISAWSEFWAFILMQGLSSLGETD